jgi:hypothetical protein
MRVETKGSTARLGAFLLVALAVAAYSQNKAPSPQSSQAPPPAAAASAQPSVQETNDAYVEKIKRQIAGHEQEPAEQVFKNILWFKGVPAGRLLLTMNLGYSRALGVTCTHCHDDSDFSKDDKRPKRAARDMAAMHRSINDQLTKMQNLEPNPKGHFINCNTCHRGAINPNGPDK